MSDDTTYFGTDTSRYQPLGNYGPGAFEIVNYQDPQRDAKVARNRAEGRPSGVYLWVYAGHDLFVDTVAMIDTVRATQGRDPELGYWADYEDVGINEDQLRAFFAGLGARGAYGGYYSGPFAVNHGAFMDHDWWNAAYPSGGPSFPGYGSLWASSRPRPMKLWQFTSNPLDQDVVTEDGWYHQLLGAPAPVPPEPPKPVPEEDNDMVRVDVNGTDVHVWAHAGRVLTRGWSAGAPKGIVAAVKAGDSDVGTVDMANPRGLAVPGGLGVGPSVFFAEAQGRELWVEFTDFGPQYHVI